MTENVSQSHEPTTPTSFGEVYQTHYRTIAGTIYRRTGDADLTDDLTSDVFLAAYRSFASFRPTEVPLRVWLLRIATNRVNRWARRRNGLRTILHRLAHALPRHEPDNHDHTRGLEPSAALAALLTLPADYQTVLSLHHLEGLSLDEVALVLSCPVSTVKSRLVRARAALRRDLITNHHTKGDPAQYAEGEHR